MQYSEQQIFQRETLSNKEILYSAANQSGTHFEEAKPEEPPYTLDDRKIDLYKKVGAWYGWSWQEFEATPIPVIKALEEDIDFQLENLNAVVYLHPTMLFFMMAVSKLFGGNKE